MNATTYMLLVAGVSGTLTLSFLLGKLVVGVNAGWRKAMYVLDALQGVEAPKGTPEELAKKLRVPGVIESVRLLLPEFAAAMVALRDLSSQVQDVSERVRRVEAQVFPNGGGSMRDEIRRVQEAVVAITDRPTVEMTAAHDASDAADRMSAPAR